MISRIHILIILFLLSCFAMACTSASAIQLDETALVPETIADSHKTDHKAAPILQADDFVQVCNQELRNSCIDPVIPGPKASASNDPIVVAQNTASTDAPTDQDSSASVNVPSDNHAAVDDPSAQNAVPSSNDLPTVASNTQQTATIPEDLSPLPDDIRQKLQSIPWDVDPEVLNAVEKENEGGHFPWSDELRPDRFYDSIHGLGGTYIGVGTDQAYVYMGWQRPTLAFAVDYDPWVICIHYGYIALFDTCNDIECFKKMLDDKNGTFNFLLNTYYATHPNKREIAKIFRANAHGISRRLNRIAALGLPTFVNDPETYRYIQTLIRTGRLVTMQANLLGNTAFKAISQTLRENGRTVTTLYTSNAEQYWGYNKAFKANIRAIPWADNGMIMRTIATKMANGDYTYRIMPHQVFLAWLDDPRGTNVYKISQSYVIRQRGEGSTEPPDIPFILDDRLPSAAKSK